MENTDFIDVSLEKERIYICSNVDALVIKRPLVILYVKEGIHIWDEIGNIHFLNIGNITHNFVIN